MEPIRYRENGIGIEVDQEAIRDFVRQRLTAPQLLQGLSASPHLVLRIGEIWKGQGGRVGGLVKGVNGKPDSVLILPTDERAFYTDVEWGPRGKEVLGARDDWDGQANTRAMLEAKCPLAQVISALEIEGHKDFYLMAKRQAPILYANLPEILGEFGWTWTSTEASSSLAWCQTFYNGTQYYDDKVHDCRAFAVRSVPLSNLVL